MKLKHIFNLLPFRKTKTFPYELTVHKTKYGEINYAQWLHPSEKRKAFSNDVLDFYSNYIKKGDLVIDIGAHTGDTTLLYGILAGKDGVVVAFEPNEYVFKVLNKNVSINIDSMSIIPYQFAAGNGSEDLIFNYSDFGFCNGGKLSEFKMFKHGHFAKLKVQSINIAKLLKSNILANMIDKLSFIKIDTEGNDLYILQALKEILKDKKPVIQTEIYKLLPHEKRITTITFLNDIGYNVFKLDDKTYSLDAITIDNLSDTGNTHFDIIAIPK